MFGRIALVLLVLGALLYLWPMIRAAGKATAKKQADLSAKVEQPEEKKESDGGNTSKDDG